MKKIWLIICLALVGATIGVTILGSQSSASGPSFVLQATTGAITLDTAFPVSPSTAPTYKVLSTDSFFEGTPKLMEVKSSIPSETEAPALAVKAMEKYGGIPDNAVLHKVESVYMNKFNLTSNTIEERYPQWTLVIYEQQIRGSPVIGPGAEIWIALGENGELLQVDKVWRTVEYAEDVPVISAEEAYEKLQKGELLEKYQSPLAGIKISDIRLGYYAEDRARDQKYFTPVWIFTGTDQGNNTIRLPVTATR